MVEKLRAETELRLLLTAAETENRDIRERILDFPAFRSADALVIQKRFIDVYLKEPNADQAVFMASLSREQQLAMIAMMQSVVSPTVEELNADGVLESLRRTSAEEDMRRDITKLLLTNDMRADALREIAESCDRMQSVSVPRDTREKYLSEYDAPVEVIPTGFPLLDKVLGGGLAKGCISALGARPSVGKTTLAVNIARYNSGRRVLFFSLEMSARMVYDKLISDVGNFDYGDCVKHRVNKETVRAVLDRYDRLTVIDDVYAVEDMAEIVRHLKPDLVIIDYIQIVRTHREIDVVRQRIDHIASVIKRTAKQTGAHIMSLSQITRGAKDEPTMSALKESGGLEETGDYVLLLKRPYVLDKSDERLRPEDAELKVDKNKFGESGLLEYYFDGAHQRFSEVGFLNEKKHGHEKDEQLARMKKEQADGQERIDGDLPF